ncbi:hypothetical protein TKK_0011465 [Trichogramma kaykai]
MEASWRGQQQRGHCRDTLPDQYLSSFKINSFKQFSVKRISRWSKTRRSKRPRSMAVESRVTVGRSADKEKRVSAATSATTATTGLLSSSIGPRPMALVPWH